MRLRSRVDEYTIQVTEDLFFNLYCGGNVIWKVSYIFLSCKRLSKMLWTYRKWFSTVPILFFPFNVRWDRTLPSSFFYHMVLWLFNQSLLSTFVYSFSIGFSFYAKVFSSIGLPIFFFSFFWKKRNFLIIHELQWSVVPLRLITVLYSGFTNVHFSDCSVPRPLIYFLLLENHVSETSSQIFIDGIHFCILRDTWSLSWGSKNESSLSVYTWFSVHVFAQTLWK